MIDRILKHSKIILAIFAIIFAIILTGISNFKLDASSDSLVLENDKDVLFYQQLRKQYPSDDNLIISYQVKQNLLSEQNLKNIKSFITELQSVDGVKNTTSILSVPLFLSPPLGLTDLVSNGVSINQGNADLSLAMGEFKTSPLYGNNLVSTDGHSTAILLDIDEKNQDKIIKNVRNIIQKHSKNANIFLGGLPMITHDIIEYIASDLLIFSVLVIVVMALVLLLAFKSLRFMLLPLGIAMITATFMTGLLGFLDWKITVISSNFFSLLLVLSLAIVVHLSVRYLEIVNTFNTQKEAVKESIKQMFKPCLYTTLTTLIAFVSLLMSGIRPVIDFGFMMAIGVVLAFIIGFMLFTTIMQLLPKYKVDNFKTQVQSTKVFAKFVDNKPNLVIVLSVILLIMAIIGISKITVENRFIDYFKETTEIHQGLAHIDKNLGGTIPVEIIFKKIGEDYFYDEEIREKIAKLHTYLENRKELGKVLSIDTLMQILASINDGQRLGGFFLNIVKAQIPEYAKHHIFTPYINEDSGEIRIVARVKETSTGLNRNNLLQSLTTDIQAMGFAEKDFNINGLMVLYNNMLQSLFDSQINTISIVFVMIWLMFALLFKSIKIATIAIIPNIIPALLVLGIMGIFNIPLDLMTITIAAIAIGIGVDNAIHYISRFKEEFIKTQDYTQSMFNAHASIGIAMFYTSFTVAIGFLVLAFSNFIPSIYFGIFTAIAMVVAMLLNLTLLPRLILLFKNFKKDLFNN